MGCPAAAPSLANSEEIEEECDLLIDTAEMVMEVQDILEEACRLADIPTRKSMGLNDPTYGIAAH